MRLTYTRGPPQGRMLSCCQMPQPASDDLAKGEPMSPEVELIRALSEDLALEILASYAPEDFADADFTSLGKAADIMGLGAVCAWPHIGQAQVRSKPHRIGFLEGRMQRCWQSSQPWRARDSEAVTGVAS